MFGMCILFYTGAAEQRETFGNSFQVVPGLSQTVKKLLAPVAVYLSNPRWTYVYRDDALCIVEIWQIKKSTKQIIFTIQYIFK